MAIMRQVRPLSVFLAGLACLLLALLLAFLQVAEPLFWLLFALAVLGMGGAYLYFAVSLIEQGRRAVGWALAWVPALALTVTTSPDIGVLPAVLVATLEAGIAVGLVALALRAARWAEGRGLPVHFA
jgi:hypothetical protein